ncbi:MAG: GNAT family N-acetyltransferase [Pseudomonadota bacterium]
MTANKNKKSAKKPKPPKKLLAHVTHLEMTHPPLRSLPVPTRPTIALMRAKNIPAEFYSFMYEMVGRAYHWENRRDLSPAEIYATINEDHCEIHILYADGCPAGFFELDASGLPKTVEILYFGLGAEFQGLGLGKWFLSAAISAAWAHKPEKVIVETNTLDHPAALPLYQRLGFSPVGVSDVEIRPWD